MNIVISFVAFLLTVIQDHAIQKINQKKFGQSIMHLVCLENGFLDLS